MEQPQPFIIADTVQSLLKQLQEEQDRLMQAVMDLREDLTPVLYSVPEPSKELDDPHGVSAPEYIARLQDRVEQARHLARMVRKTREDLRLHDPGVYLPAPMPVPAEPFTQPPVQPYPRPPAMPKS